MQKNIQPIVQEFRSRPFSYIVQVVGILVILANLWLVNKLFPIYKSIDEITFQVKTIEADLVKTNGVIIENKVMLEKLEGINIKLEAIEQRVERIDSRLAKHMGI